MKLPRAFRLLAFGLLLAVIPPVLSSPSAAQIGIGISVRVGPPALPIYEQPLCPGPGYLWTPGYWAWDDDDGYYWVPGTWVVAPVGELWTPGYWGWGEGAYLWHAGYWGPHIGFYGGINYGFGYGGVGFFGGEWRGGAFFYNTAVMRVDTVRITNVYVNRTVIVNNNSHVAFNGGQGGVAARPTLREEEWSREQHQPALAAQTEHQHAASQNKALFAANNHGRPAVAATARPGDFSGRGVVKAKAAGAPYHAPSISPKQARATAGTNNGTAAANRPAENRTSSASGSKAANRPFVPPNKSNPKSSPSNRTETANRSANSKPSSTRPSESHAAKPFTPPPSSHASNNSHASSPRTESAPRNESRPASPSRPSHASAPPAHESRPAPQARESAPRPAPRESAPHASAPRPQRESAPPKHEAPPKAEHKGR